MGWDLNIDLFDCVLKVDYKQRLVTRQAWRLGDEIVVP